MYKPCEINNIELLSSYLRTQKSQLLKFTEGDICIWDNNPNKYESLNESINDSLIDINIEKYYIPKKNQKLGYRIVYEIRTQFALDIIKNLTFNLDEIYQPLECVHGFIRGRNTLSNAKQHLGKKFLLNIDLKNFFDNISAERIETEFEKFGYQKEIAKLLSKIVTINGALAQGYNSSPIISNIVASKMDSDLMDFCSKNNLTYTRYSDDISISSDIALPEKEIIEQIINNNGFILNPLKTKTFKRGQNQFVTGLSIFDEKQPRIPKHIKKRLRQQQYYIGKYGFDSHISKKLNIDDVPENCNKLHDLSRKLRNNIEGWINYIYSIEPEFAKKQSIIFHNNEIKNRDIFFEKAKKFQLIKNNFQEKNSTIEILKNLNNSQSDYIIM